MARDKDFNLKSSNGSSGLKSPSLTGNGPYNQRLPNNNTNLKDTLDPNKNAKDNND